MQFIDIRTLCDWVGGSRPVNPATVYRMIKRRQLPLPVKVGGSSRWLVSEVEAFITKAVEAR
jgi:predicted DNA-binding transcriptional regulator AlpA